MTTVPPIYISTMAFLGQSPTAIVEAAAQEKFPLEFSSALPHDPLMEDHFANYPHPKLVHNYFPAPRIPFVLNLASANPIIRTQSIEHCLKGLRWSAKAGADFYCAHAGFCLDPQPEELGKQLTHPTQPIDRKKHWNLFLDSVRTLLKIADILDLNFYIENNVTAKMNLDAQGTSPLLCSTPEEMLQLMTDLPHPRLGILLDTAHLKVSSFALNFSMTEGVKSLRSVVKAIHHSDNAGVLDNNQPLTNDYWFLPFMPWFNTLPQVLEVKAQKIQAIKAQMVILQKAATL